MGVLSYFKSAKSKGQTTGKNPNRSGESVGSQSPKSQSGDSMTSWIMDARWNIMADYLRLQQLSRGWASGHDQGVVVKRSKNDFVCSPPELAHVEGEFLRAVEMLNVQVAMTVETPVIKQMFHSEYGYAHLPNGLRLQVLPDLAALPMCQKNQSVAFVASRGQLIIWDDDPSLILARVAKLEEDLLSIIWKGKTLTHDTVFEVEKKSAEVDVSVAELHSDGGDTDSEAARGSPSTQRRKLYFAYPVISCLAVALAIGSLGSSYGNIAKEVRLDGNYIRCALALMFPFVIWASLFFWQAAITSIFQIVGPIHQVHENTRFYSGVRPPRLDRNRQAGLPHITIQMPCYKESLEGVIKPTVRSVKDAIARYEMQGGTANIFINDDGLQLIPEADRQTRLEFYEENSIGWVARPGHNPDTPEKQSFSLFRRSKAGQSQSTDEEKAQKPIFHRRGKFKKASNMNYALWISCRVEEKLLERQEESWSAADEAHAYHACLTEVCEEDEGMTWADGDIRIGDYILLVDCDTRVPKDCLLDAVSEMELNPDVAILQHTSGVMNVTTSFFEKGITFFTNLVYSQIKFAVASGDVAPFVGHNAILRWEAIQFIGYDDPLDQREKWWSEETVSEDFDMALRLQAAGYVVRLASYSSPTGEVYEEGVSITVYDELARWEKYAYGCSELVFNPFRYWFTRSPFTKIFRTFITSRMPFSSKLTIMAYVGTYYAIGSTWIFAFVNYFAVGWYGGWLDTYYKPSFSTYLSLVVVFTLLGSASLGIMRWRLNEKAIVPAMVEIVSWLPLMGIFLGGLSLHVSQALLSHLFSVDMQWGSTNKEAVDRVSFGVALRKVFLRFKFTYAFCTFCTVMMIVLANFVPPFWQIKAFVAIWPLSVVVCSHAALPIALNPELVVFSW